MQITKDTVVQFHYTLSDDTGVLENSRSQDPVLYLQGHGNLIEGLEKSMEGHQAGDQFNVTLAPADAYGEIAADSIQSVQVKHLMGAKKWKPGMVAVVNTEQGQRQVTVVKVGMFKAEVDTNHPLAGKTLSFDIDVIDVRAASAEEIEHGHAHGVGGHHHH
ncbi:peptidylprolyl isomerase [Rheinheimera soli]|uniref:Peptidyl-prolyl cis-trans isomerase n=1 Tax=Rheinheimera soli TaxID=443616 RepID=A0ABU1VTS8_9GAMM|nr:peptidylprolyl isomerase [Rheinheimera soli]MDR7119136.1 FKBP-type peptidyl-prolyl cis-trans isomerase SlyD [Rheinheimera soli]